MSLLLSGASVVTSLAPPAVIRADVRIEGHRIVSVGSGSGSAGRPPAPPPREPAAPRAGAVEQLDCAGCLIIPGNVCAHTHLYSALARGMPYDLAPPQTFVQVLQRIWWRLDRALDAPSVRASALAGGLEALLSGTTTLLDHHASPNAVDGSLDVVAEALAELGVRSVCCYEVTDRDGPERARAGVSENRRFLARVAQDAFPLARGMVGAHASFTLSEETLDGCVALARESGAGIHIHVAEDAADEVDAERRFGSRVVERLARCGALGHDTLLAHGVHLGEDEARLVREAGATVAHNPRSNMNNAVGRTPLALLGERVALGTDGIGADMFAESQAAFFRLRDEGGTPAPGWPLERLSQGAALAGRAFGEPRLGRIEPGAPADLVVLDYAAPAPLDERSLAGHWIYALGARHVRDVIVAGRIVIRDRRSTLLDQDAMMAEAQVRASGLWDRLERIDVHPFEPQEVHIR